MTCPICASPIEEDSYVRTVANHEGEPEEEHTNGVFCSNLDCEHNGEPIEEIDDFDDDGCNDL